MENSFFQLLMVSPEFFDIAYAINAHMLDASGQLKKPDRALARRQWDTLLKTFRQQLDLKVHVIPGHPELPDMVFAANQVFPFVDPQGRKTVILSQMRANERRPEVEFFRKFFHLEGFEVLTLPQSSWCFEGNGDALLHPDKPLIWGGYGPRTDVEVYEFVSQVTGRNVVPLELKNPKYYHLDTCLSILDARTAAVVEDAFTEEGIKLIRDGFPQVIEIDPLEAEFAFVGNAFCPNGHDIVVQGPCPKFKTRAAKLGFRTHEVDTSEFIKAGGSVFCMKMAFP